MTTRRYYLDATTTDFTAVLVDQLTVDGRAAIILDQTYFYPTSGGQPHDTGTINDGRMVAAVIDVIASAPDAPVLHILNKPWTGASEVAGAIDWPRRFDHMQQHTGQHILSQAFIRTAGAETVGFHLSDQTVTIDLAAGTLDAEQLASAETLANDVVWANLPISIQMVDPEVARSLPLRKLPPQHDGQIRLIGIGEFDLTACGGTHVAATGQVGLIKVIKTEHRGNLTRVEFRCGLRALQDYQRRLTITTELSSILTTGADELPAAVARLQDDGRAWRATAAAYQKDLIRHEAEDLLQHTLPISDGYRVIVASYADRELDSLRSLASQLVAAPNTVALLALGGTRTQFVFGRSADAPGHMGDLLKATLAKLDGAKGGGSPTMAQGSGPAANAAIVADLLEAARRQLQQMAKPVE